MPKVRLDTLLAQRGVFESGTRAAASIMAGEVRLGTAGERAQKPGQMVTEDAVVSVDEAPRHVSRVGRSSRTRSRRWRSPSRAAARWMSARPRAASPTTCSSRGPRT